MTKPKPAAKKAAPTKQAAPKPPTPRDRIEAMGEVGILNLIAQGESMRNIARLLDSPVSTLHAWLAETPERSQAHARSREAAAESYDDMALESLERADRENISVAREIAAHYRWRAKAANPKRYSDKLQLDATVETKVVGDAELLAGLAKLGLAAKVNGPD
jgi:hypothetical protein